MKKLWNVLFPPKKEEPKLKAEERPVFGFLELPRPFEEEDITEIDKDRIRYSCKLSPQDVPEFPSREEVKKRIEDAHKFYGIPSGGRVNAGDADTAIPPWYPILDRPLVEQYVLMSNYIRKLSVLAALRNHGSENSTIEEEASVSEASSSDYSDFAENSNLVEVYRKSKKSKLHCSAGNRENSELVKRPDENVTSNVCENSIARMEDILLENQRKTSGLLCSKIAAGDATLSSIYRDSKKDRNISDELPGIENFDISMNFQLGLAEIEGSQKLQISSSHLCDDSSANSDQVDSPSNAQRETN